MRVTQAARIAEARHTPLVVALRDGLGVGYEDTPTAASFHFHSTPGFRQDENPA